MKSKHKTQSTCMHSLLKFDMCVNRWRINWRHLYVKDSFQRDIKGEHARIQTQPSFPANQYQLTANGQHKKDVTITNYYEQARISINLFYIQFRHVDYIL